MTSPSVIPLPLCIESIEFDPSMGVSHWMKKVQFEWDAVSFSVNNKKMVKGSLRRLFSCCCWHFCFNRQSWLQVGTGQEKTVKEAKVTGDHFVFTQDSSSSWLLSNKEWRYTQFDWRWWWRNWYRRGISSLGLFNVISICLPSSSGMNHEWVRSLVPEKRLSNETMMMSCFFLFLIPLVLREKSILYWMTYVVDSAMVSPSINVLPLSMTTGREGGGEEEWRTRDW